ncbi:MAG: transglycosylase domain-containing protein [Hyphomonadaceae bacterium]
MKIALRVAIPLLVVAMLVAIAFGVGFWMDGSSVISQAERDGDLPASAETIPLNAAERTIAAALFPDSWSIQRVPCRTFERAWNTLVSRSERLSGMTVSEQLSQALQMRKRPERSIQNVFRQLFVACQLELRYSDTEMLRIWLATAYFGVEPRGIENAAQAIFGKRAADLNDEESVRLTALLYAPGLLSDQVRWIARARTIAERISAKAQ